MKKEDVLLRLIAISGEMPAELVREVVGSESYAAVLVTKLKKEGFISVRNSGGYKGYILRSKSSGGFQTKSEHCSVRIPGFHEIQSICQGYGLTVCAAW